MCGGGGGVHFAVTLKKQGSLRYYVIEVWIVDCVLQTARYFPNGIQLISHDHCNIVYHLVKSDYARMRIAMSETNSMSALGQMQSSSQERSMYSL